MSYTAHLLFGGRMLLQAALSGHLLGSAGVSPANFGLL